MNPSLRGQAVIEYLLLLFVCVTIAILLTDRIVSRQAGDEGFLMQYWRGIIVAIGSDDAQNPPEEE
jgi:hypothetical protein